jgi:hypothetical protein
VGVEMVGKFEEWNVRRRKGGGGGKLLRLKNRNGKRTAEKEREEMERTSNPKSCGKPKPLCLCGIENFGLLRQPSSRFLLRILGRSLSWNSVFSSTSSLNLTVKNQSQRT